MEHSRPSCRYRDCISRHDGEWWNKKTFCVGSRVRRPAALRVTGGGERGAAFRDRRSRTDRARSPRAVLIHRGCHSRGLPRYRARIGNQLWHPAGCSAERNASFRGKGVRAMRAGATDSSRSSFPKKRFWGASAARSRKVSVRRTSWRKFAPPKLCWNSSPRGSAMSSISSWLDVRTRQRPMSSASLPELSKSTAHASWTRCTRSLSDLVRTAIAAAR